MENNSNFSAEVNSSLSEQELEHKKESSNSMILGIVGVILSIYPVIGIAGIVISAVALIKSNKNMVFSKVNRINENGMNIAGKWCGLSGIIIGGILFLAYTFVFVLFVLVALGIIQKSGIFPFVTHS